MQEKRALGRGLSSLIPMSGRGDAGDKKYMECPLEDIVPNQNQPRKLFDKTAIDELAASIEEKGIIQPLLVRKLGGGKFELIAGERRYRAAQQLHLERVPVVIRETDAQESLELALIENIQRENLNPIEESLAYKELIAQYQYTQEELARRLGKDRSTIANSLRLLKLPEEVRAYIISGKISMGHARALLGVEEKDLQIKVAEEIVNNELSVRDIESWVRKFKEHQEEKVLRAVPEEEVDAATTTTTKTNAYRNLEDQMRRNLGTRVQIKSLGDKGKIVIHFHSPDELNRLLQTILPGG